MKKFKFRYSSLIWILLTLVLVFCIIGLAWNIFNLTQYVWAGTVKILSYSLIIAMTAFLIIFVLSIMFYGNYVIKKGYLFTYFGLIYSKTKISEIVQITHFKKSDKLVAYFADQKYSVIVISPSAYDEFVLELRKENPAIYYSNKIDGEDLAE